MSLKAFHIVFIIVSILLGFGVGSFCLWRWNDSGDGSWLGLGLVFLASGIALLIYSKRIMRKMKKFSYL